MINMTLLEIVQDVLLGLDLDQVDSIVDTVESEQVAKICKECFVDMVGQRAWPFKRKLIQLEAVSDSTKPTMLRIPKNVNRVTQLYYDTSCNEKRFSQINNVTPDEFIQYVMTYDATASNTISYTLLTSPNRTATTVELLAKNDTQPTMWTSFDDYYIVMNAYDSSIDDTLQSSKTLTWGEVQPTFRLADDHTPDIPEHFLPYYLNDIRNTAWINLKGTAHPKYAAELRRHRNRLQASEWRQNGKPGVPNYGR